MRFVDELPPPDRRGPKIKYEAVAVECQRNKGRWGLWKTFDNSNSASSYVYHVNKGTLKAFQPPGAYEAAARKNEKGTFDVWIRYVGQFDDGRDHG